MVIVGLSGGLGNQLQQYALYRKYVSIGVDARIDTSWFDHDVQTRVATPRKVELDRLAGVDYEICTDEEKQRFAGRNLTGMILCLFGLKQKGCYEETGIYDPDLLEFTDKYVEGSFTCEYYYADILPDIRRNIRFPIESSSNRTELERIILDIGLQYSISIHIRRGDYLDDINRAIYGNICTDAYYSSALDAALENVEQARLYVFSDDSEYAWEYTSKLVDGYDKLLSFEVVNINHGDDSLFDMYLMSLCDCNITANSTFSYWGARFNAKDSAVKIRPTIHKNTQEFVPDEMFKLWKGWVFVSPEGRVYNE